MDGRLTVLDAMRFIAAAVVVFYHATQMSGGTALLSHGYLAVDFFFILSGFVIARRYEREWQAGAAPTRFLVHRIGRLWPTIAAAIATGGMLAWFAGESASAVLAAVARQFAFVPNLNGTAALYPLDGVQWSLMLEIFANVAHCILLRRMPRRTIGAVTVIAALALCAIAWRDDNLALGATASTLFPGFIRVTFGYSAGVLLFRSEWCAPGRTRAGWPLLMLPAILLAAGLAPADWAWLVDVSIVLIAMPILVWLGATARLKSLAARAADSAGAWSYPLYAFHLPVVTALALVIGMVPTAPVMVLGISILVSILWLRLERLLRRAARWGIAWSRERRGPLLHYETSV